MPLAPHSLQLLTRQTRAFAPALLASREDPHAELMALVWGPRFDREHALGACAAEDVEIEKCPQRGQFLPNLQPHS